MSSDSNESFFSREESSRTDRIVFNGKEYSGVEEMPPAEREAEFTVPVSGMS